MAQAEFSVHLGGGLYMDSNGVLSRGRDPGKPVYAATPGSGLPVSLDAVAKAFQGMANALPNDDDPKSYEKFEKIFRGIGMLSSDRDNLISFLQTAGTVASVIGSVVPVVGAALAVLTMLIGLFKDGPTALETLMNERFKETNRRIRALEVMVNRHVLLDQHVVIGNTLSSIGDYVDELRKTPLNPVQLLLLHQDVRSKVEQTGIAVQRLLIPGTWESAFESNEYNGVWPWIAHRLFTFPSAGGPQRALFPVQAELRFDHRYMVPLTIYAVTAYLTLLRTVAPEFRSTMDKRSVLRRIADHLQKQAEEMRRKSLARTVYVAADFKSGPGGGVPWGFGPEEVVDIAIPGAEPFLAPGNTRFAVGAIDLLAHNDAYFTQGFTAAPIQLPGEQYARQGLLDVRWIPPARLERYEEQVPSLGWEPANQAPPTRTRYRITNPEECADAANTLAEENYVDLLYGSGYLSLTHLVATLRNEATDPDRSQTVRSEAWLRRKAGPSANVIVEGQPTVFAGGAITAAAERVPYQSKATTRFSTQPVGRDRTLTYRIWLRTLHANYSPIGGSWFSEQEYSSYHHVRYASDAENPGFQKLFASTGNALDELKIAEGASGEGASGSEALDEPKTAVLNAITFDWWIPVEPIGHAERILDAVLKQAPLRAVGWEPEGGTIVPPKGAGAARPLSATRSAAAIAMAAAVLDDLPIGWEDGKEPSKGQRRLPALSEIQIDYALRWQADRMTVSFANNRPADRNYVVYVVVEEKLGSGLVLHTFERIPVTGQLTLVPQSFLDEEAEAHARKAGLFRDFAVRYAKSLPRVPQPGVSDDPGPAFGRGDGLLGLDRQLVGSDPVLRQLQRDGFVVEGDFRALAALALRHPPAAQVLRQTLTETGLSEAELRTWIESSDGLAAAIKIREQP